MTRLVSASREELAALARDRGLSEVAQRLVADERLITELRAAIEMVAPQDGITEDMECVWCGAFCGFSDSYTKGVHPPEKHADDCAWALARAALAKE